MLNQRLRPSNQGSCKGGTDARKPGSSNQEHELEQLLHRPALDVVPFTSHRFAMVYPCPATGMRRAVR